MQIFAILAELEAVPTFAHAAPYPKSVAQLLELTWGLGGPFYNREPDMKLTSPADALSEVCFAMLPQSQRPSQQSPLALPLVSSMATRQSSCSRISQGGSACWCWLDTVHVHLGHGVFLFVYAL